MNTDRFLAALRAALDAPLFSVAGVTVYAASGEVPTVEGLLAEAGADEDLVAEEGWLALAHDADIFGVLSLAQAGAIAGSVHNLSVSEVGGESVLIYEPDDEQPLAVARFEGDWAAVVGPVAERFWAGGGAGFGTVDGYPLEVLPVVPDEIGVDTDWVSDERVRAIVRAQAARLAGTGLGWEDTPIGEPEPETEADREAVFEAYWQRIYADE